MPSFSRLLECAEDSGVRVEWARIAGPHSGAYDLGRRTIYLDWDLDTRPRHAVSTLAHELAHDLYSDMTFGVPWIEARADRQAALWLICPGKYRRAERMYGPDVHALAVELGVTTRLVEAYRLGLSRAA